MNTKMIPLNTYKITDFHLLQCDGTRHYIISKWDSEKFEDGFCDGKCKIQEAGKNENTLHL